MTKKDIIDNIKNGIENLMWKNECKAFIDGYLGALLDCYEIDYDTYEEIHYEVKVIYND